MSCNCKNRYMPIRKIDSQIFMGNCSRGCTESQMLICIEQLHEGFMVLSGMQQNGLQGHEFDKKSDKKDKEHLEIIVRDIAMALTGMEIFFDRKNKK